MVKVRTRQEVSADHLQTVASRPVASQHQSRCLNRSLHHSMLALVEFEVVISQGSVSFPVSSFSTSCLNCSFGISRALCNQVAQSKRCRSHLATLADSSSISPPKRLSPCVAALLDPPCNPLLLSSYYRHFHPFLAGAQL